MPPRPFRDLRTLCALQVGVLLASAAAAGAAEVAADDLSYQIALDQRSFLPGEPVFVSCTLRNESERVLSVFEPSDVAVVVTFDLAPVTDEPAEADDSSEGGGGAAGGGGPPIWRPRRIELRPGEEYTTTSILPTVASPEQFRLDPGRYVLTSRYHLVDPRQSVENLRRYDRHVYDPDRSSEQYRREVAEADGVEFEVRTPSAEEAKEWNQLLEEWKRGRGVVGRGGAAPRPGPGRPILEEIRELPLPH